MTFLRKNTINKIESGRNRIMELKQTKFNIDCKSNNEKKERKKKILRREWGEVVEPRKRKSV